MRKSSIIHKFEEIPQQRIYFILLRIRIQEAVKHVMKIRIYRVEKHVLLFNNMIKVKLFSSLANYVKFCY